MQMRSLMPLLLCAIGIGCTSACSGAKTIDRDRARSEIRSALSLASETETFLEFVLQRRVMRHYAEAHTAYLQEEVERSAKDLDQAVADPATAADVGLCRSGLHRLLEELSAIHAALDEPGRLIADRDKISQIRAGLEKAITRS
jgi:hypothetical protein